MEYGFPHAAATYIVEYYSDGEWHSSVPYPFAVHAAAATALSGSEVIACGGDTNDLRLAFTDK